MINAADFINTVHTEAVDTTRTPIPVGEYNGQIGTDQNALSIASGTSTEGKPWARLDVNITVPDPSGAIKAATGRDPVIVRYGVMLDLVADGSKLDLSQGKNIRLGKLLSAAGWPLDDKNRLTSGWSFSFLAGKAVHIKVSHEPNPNDATTPYERVDAVTKVS